jgi:hypothetical protein
MLNKFSIWAPLITAENRDVISPVTITRLAEKLFSRAPRHSLIPRELSVPNVPDSKSAQSGIPCTAQRETAGKTKPLPRKSLSG